MANHRQKKKKKSAAASKQAATQYKGKNAPVKAAPVKKDVVKQEQTAKPAAETKKPQPAKTQSKKSQPKQVETAKAQTKKEKPKQQKAKKQTKKKFNPAKLPLSELIKAKVEEIGVRKCALGVLIVTFAIALVCVLLWVTSSRFGIPDAAIIEYKGKDYPSSITHNVNEDLETQYEFADKMKRKGDKKAFRYYAAEELVLVDKNSQGELNLVNVTDNECVLIASIVDEEGNICFQSKGIPPGQRLVDIGINERPYGTYDMKLVVAGYVPDDEPGTYKLIGIQRSDLTVQVGIEEETSDVQETEKK